MASSDVHLERHRQREQRADAHLGLARRESSARRAAVGSRTPSSCSPTASRATRAPVALEQPGLLCLWLKRLGGRKSQIRFDCVKFWCHGFKVWCQVLVSSFGDERPLYGSVYGAHPAVHPPLRELGGPTLFAGRSNRRGRRASFVGAPRQLEPLDDASAVALT